MARGPKKHMKRIQTPKSWMIKKLGGIWCQRPRTGPHKLRESIPLGMLVQRRLRVAMNAREATLIVKDKEGSIKIDQKIRRDVKFPVGCMDVFSVEKTGQNYRVLYDCKGRFILRKVNVEEAKFKVLKVTQKKVGPNQIPYIVTNDGRTLRFPNPEIDVYDSIKLNLLDNKIEDFAKFEIGNICYVEKGNNVGRVGILTNRERHLGNFDIVHMRDNNGNNFATRIGNIMVIGKGKKPFIQLPKDNGLALNALQLKLKQEDKTKKK